MGQQANQLGGTGMGGTPYYMPQAPVLPHVMFQVSIFFSFLLFYFSTLVLYFNFAFLFSERSFTLHLFTVQLFFSFSFARFSDFISIELS